MDCNKRNIIRSLGLFVVLLCGAPLAMAASAPPLTHVQVLKVQSAACGIENIADGQAQTTCDHGGANIKVYVLEMGYGRVPHASLDGFSLDGMQTKVCAYDNGNPTECSGAATRIVGTLYIFDLGGYQGGTFTFSNTSINAPGNTLATQLYIK
ncbi:YolA family protein [Pseudomonas sp. N3-W]|uniref:YolA family protein n=1 Tax=Pseudomonas fungipugnans TaxID=3024217 RepID=A0ABT6QMM3_9PSED|nr:MULTISPECIES: YolA family protein [unclassified Pseudomonas]MDI2592115.1 YolA family protein [Pseudomonas sp. 681]UWF48602.1 YolA family protein [Pseudomonas sp. N3-W]